MTRARGFEREPSDGTLSVSVDGSGTWVDGFVRDAAGKLCVTQNATGAVMRDGFLRSPSGLLVADLDGTTSKIVGGIGRTSTGAMVLTQTPTGKPTGGLFSSPAGALVVTGNFAGALSAAIPTAAQAGGLAWFNDYEQASPWLKEDNKGGTDWLQKIQLGCQDDQITVASCAALGIQAPPGLTTAKKVVRFSVSPAQFAAWFNDTTLQFTGNYGYPHAKSYTIWGTDSGWANPPMGAAGEDGAYYAWYRLPSTHPRFPRDIDRVKFSNIFQFKTDNNRIITTCDILPYDGTAGANAGFWICFNGWVNSYSSLGSDGLSFKIDSLLDTWMLLKAVINHAAGTITWYINGTQYCSYAITVRQPGEDTLAFGRGHYAGIGSLDMTNAYFIPGGR